VTAFLERRLNFASIAVVIESVLDRVTATPVCHLDDVLVADQEARRTASQCIARLEGRSPAGALA